MTETKKKVLTPKQKAQQAFEKSVIKAAKTAKKWKVSEDAILEAIASTYKDKQEELNQKMMMEKQLEEGLHSCLECSSQ